jgi:hypothetical protein
VSCSRLGTRPASLVGRMLHYLGYSLQANAKVTEDAQHADRDAQFRYINDQAAEHLAAGQPVISVDCKEKELVGDYANGGREWEPTGRAHPSGDARLSRRRGRKGHSLRGVRHRRQRGVGQRRRRPRHARVRVASIARSWERMGKARYPEATRFMITADAGGSNSYQSRLWKTELAKLVANIGLMITVCHMPPETSKWNKSEHRLFSFISMNWRGKPLTTYRVIVSLIAATTTRTGLR